MTQCNARAHAGAVDAEDAFWALARQARFYTADPHATYARLKRDWQERHPEASHTEHEDMTRRLAELLRV